MTIIRGTIDESNSTLALPRQTFDMNNSTASDHKSDQWSLNPPYSPSLSCFKSLHTLLGFQYGSSKDFWISGKTTTLLQQSAVKKKDVLCFFNDEKATMPVAHIISNTFYLEHLHQALTPHKSFSAFHGGSRRHLSFRQFSTHSLI